MDTQQEDSVFLYGVPKMPALFDSSAKIASSREAMILSGLEDVAAYSQGDNSRVRVTKIPINNVNVQLIRQKLDLTQQEFADRFQLPLATIRNWEQGRRKPEGAARILLQMIESKPDSVYSFLQERHV